MYRNATRDPVARLAHRRRARRPPQCIEGNDGEARPRYAVRARARASRAETLDIQAAARTRRAFMPIPERPRGARAAGLRARARGASESFFTFVTFCYFCVTRPLSSRLPAGFPRAPAAVRGGGGPARDPGRRLDLIFNGECSAHGFSTVRAHGGGAQGLTRLYIYINTSVLRVLWSLAMLSCSSLRLGLVVRVVVGR